MLSSLFSPLLPLQQIAQQIKKPPQQIALKITQISQPLVEKPFEEPISKPQSFAREEESIAFACEPIEEPFEEPLEKPLGGEAQPKSGEERQPQPIEKPFVREKLLLSQQVKITGREKGKLVCQIWRLFALRHCNWLNHLQ